MPASTNGASEVQQPSHRVNRTNNKQSTQFSRCQTAGVCAKKEGFGSCKEEAPATRIWSWQQPQRIFDDSARAKAGGKCSEHVTALFRITLEVIDDQCRMRFRYCAIA